VAQYRGGNFKDAISSLQKSRDLRTSEGEYSNPFFLAMAHWRLGDKDEARRWYDKGAQWMDKQRAPSVTLQGFRREAGELLGVDQKR
jgi:Flp pilus assembly protein TadD